MKNLIESVIEELKSKGRDVVLLDGKDELLSQKIKALPKGTVLIIDDVQNVEDIPLG